MIGIYKITNLINNHCYVGQSRNINKRWTNHKSAAYNPAAAEYDYPLYRAMRKYGIDQFLFEVLEECSVAELNQKERFWIQQLTPIYNQTSGGDCAPVPQKLTLLQVMEIQSILINDPEGAVSHKELAAQYGVHKDTIRDINVGRTWHNDDYVYPLHYSKFDRSNPNVHHQKYYCIDCNKEVSAKAQRCVACAAKQSRVVERPTREELKEMIRTQSFVSIGKQYNVTDNTIRKWCKAENLPFRVKDIKSYSDEEWALI